MKGVYEPFSVVFALVPSGVDFELGHAGGIETSGRFGFHGRPAQLFAERADLGRAEVAGGAIAGEAFGIVAQFDAAENGLTEDFRSGFSSAGQKIVHSVPGFVEGKHFPLRGSGATTLSPPFNATAVRFRLASNR